MAMVGFFIGLALLSWHFLMPDLNTMKHLSIRWIGLLFVQNWSYSSYSRVRAFAPVRPESSGYQFKYTVDGSPSTINFPLWKSALG